MKKPVQKRVVPLPAHHHHYCKMRPHVPAEHHKRKPHVLAAFSNVVEGENEETLEPDEDANLVLCATHHQMPSSLTLRDKLEITGIIVVIMVVLTVVLAFVCYVVCASSENSLARAQMLTEMVSFLPHVLAIWSGGPVHIQPTATTGGSSADVVLDPMHYAVGVPVHAAETRGTAVDKRGVLVPLDRYY